MTPNTTNIKIDPIEVNGEIEELKEIYQDFYNEFNIIYEEYKNINYQQYINQENNIEEINQNLEKALDLCEIYTIELNNKNSNTIYNIGNISKNYNIQETKKIKTIAQPIANFISLKDHINYYNNQLIIWNTIYTEKIENPENKTKNLQKEINHNISKLIQNNEEIKTKILEYQYKLKNTIQNKYLEAKIDTETLETYTYFKTKTITEKHGKINLALEELAQQIENIEDTNQTIDYTLDIIKNNIDWTKQLNQIIIKTKQTIKKHNYTYLNQNLDNAGEKYKNQLEYILNGYLIGEENKLQELIQIFNEKSKEKNKSELIKAIKIYQKQLENLIIQIQNLNIEFN